MASFTTVFAWRYLRSRKSANAINIISWISVVAITVVTAALVVVLSVFNGFEDLVKSLYTDFYADIRITAATGKWTTADDSTLQKIKSVPGVAAAEPVIEERAILLQEEDKSIVWLKGVSSTYSSVNGISRHIIRGAYALGDSIRPALVLGSGVENALQLLAGESVAPVTVYLPNPSAGLTDDPLSAVVSANAMAAGSFSIQQEFDNQYAITDVGFMQYMLQPEAGKATAIEILVKKGASADALAENIQKILGKGVAVKTRFQQNQSLFAAMQMEKVVIFAVAFLILLVAAFNIISSLTMTVIEKERDMSVLKAMGATAEQITSLYLQLGALLAGIGGLAGFILGVLICAGQQQFHWVKLGGQSFIIDYYPVAMRWPDFFWIGLIISGIAIIAGWLPARKAAKQLVPLK